MLCRSTRNWTITLTCLTILCLQSRWSSLHLSKRMSGMESIRLRLRTCPPPGYRPESSSSVGLELGGLWSFYKEFYASHGLTAALSFVKPQTVLSSGHSLWVPLLLHNDTRESHDLVLRASLPDGWTSTSKESTYHLESHSSYPAQLFLTAPATKAGREPQELRWTLLENGKPIGEATLLVFPQ